MATADRQRPVFTKAEARAKLAALAAHLRTLLKPRPVQVGLSGGPDSTLLLALAAELSAQDPAFIPRAVHCVHGLDADDPIWLEHCRRLTAKLHIPLIVKRLHIVYENRVSPEDSSRQERYRALLEELHGDYLFLGHQGNDNAENFFLALKRGSGPAGLAGMREVTRDSRGTIVRPLLTLSRAEVEALTAALNLPTVFDISNTYLKFERNFWRLKVLPLIEERFPQFLKAVHRTQELCAQEHELACRLVLPELKRRMLEGERSLDCKDLDLADAAYCLQLLRLFTAHFMERPPELSLLKEALRLMAGAQGRVGRIELVPGEAELRRFRTKLYLVDPRQLQLNLPQADGKSGAESTRLNLRVGERLNLGSFSYELSWADSTEDQAAATEDLVFAAPPEAVGQGLCLNFKVPGSLMLQPKGRAHRRELKKLYTEYGVPQWLRPALALIETPSGLPLALSAAFACVLPERAENYVKLCLKVFQQGTDGRVRKLRFDGK